MTESFELANDKYIIKKIQTTIYEYYIYVVSTSN